MSETELPPSWDGSVVLDIGGDIGALVLRVPPGFDGQEIDLDPADPGLPHTHSRVRERRLSDGVTYSAVYPGLKEGVYTIEGSGQLVTIVGGRVAVVHYETVASQLQVST